MAQLLFLLVIFVLIFGIYGHVLLYETERSESWEYSDCIYYHSMLDATPKYCLRPDNITSIKAEYTECFNSGEKWFFKALLERHVTPHEILKWSSSAEKVDDYAKFYYDKSLLVAENNFLCNCSKRGTFGKYCEYQLLFNTMSFSESIENQFLRKRDIVENQRWAAIVCYETLSCDFGLLCLDWRNICDGQQQCMDGLDEESCDKLEFNECEENEYRCSNGMCIPDLYFLDGENDCMDQTDENSIEDPECFIIPLPIECDETISGRDYWSCGDGEQITASSRWPFQTAIRAIQYCNNLRNFNYMCETYTHESIWTRPNGMCEFEENYDDPRFDMTRANLSSQETCVYLLRCALTNGFERDCPCGENQSCSNLMTSLCPDIQRIQFPSAGLVRPYLLTFYTIREDYRDKTPARFVLSGSIQCRGYRGEASENSNITIPLISLESLFSYNQKDHQLCTNAYIERNISTLAKYFPKHCWNDSRTFSNQSYNAADVCLKWGECISSYRIRDGELDCVERFDELIHRSTSPCAKMQQHRFQCSFDDLSCLIPKSLFDRVDNCANKFDVYAYGHGTLLRDISCNRRHDDDCHFLKTYIEQSSANATINEFNSQSVESIRHDAYCNGFWDAYPPMDEHSNYCKYWACRDGFFRCKTDQCIPIDWVCDGEWDCSDASDEQGIFIYEDVWNRHPTNVQLENIIQNCKTRYTRQSFSDQCNISTEFPCLRINVRNPLDIINNRPCISLTQIGDGLSHCYGDLDERNTAVGCRGHMLGFDFWCANQSKCITFIDMCSLKCPTGEDDVLCFHKSKTNTCAGPNDVVCINGECKTDARCNGTYECIHGEDEYRCPHSGSPILYRLGKQDQQKRQPYEIYWQLYPSNTSHLLSDPQKPVIPVDLIDNADNLRNTINTSGAFICNRGMAVQLAENIVCLCSGAYYGDRCQYFSDRITIITHLNLTHTPYAQSNVKSTIIKIIAYLLFEHRQIIDLHEFNIRTGVEHLTHTKHKFYLVYSRSPHLLKHKQQRYFNRTDIIHNQFYSVRFEAFELQHNQTIEIGVWNYPIYFDFLPSFRLATILRFPKTYLKYTPNSCVNVSCNSNSICRFLFVDKKVTSYCSCQSGYYGDDCQYFDGNCSNYCSAGSICRPFSRSLLSGSTHPLCICPLNRFGPRCNLYYDDCQSNPCQNNGICYQTYDPTGMRPFMCECQNTFYGEMCQNSKSAIYIQISPTSFTDDTLASVVQYYDVNHVTLKLILHHQQVSFGILSHLQFNHDQNEAPVLGVLKRYISLSSAQYYILYIQPKKTSINITSIIPQYCPHASSLFQNGKTSFRIGSIVYCLSIVDDVPLVFKYHQICSNDSHRLCFYDDVYLCICEVSRKRVDCFDHDVTIDHCEWCLSGGNCIRGDRKMSTDFICLCPHCYSGRLCEFSLQPFTVTFDSLLVFERHFIQIIYIGMALVLFIVGFVNNLFSSVTFLRPQTRQNSVGNCLLATAIFNQCALLCLLVKILHIFLGSSVGSTDDISCKIINYSLSVFTRSTNWLTSWITADRLFIAIYPAAKLIQKPSFAIWSSIIIFLLMLIMHIHEILFSSSIYQSHSTISLCVISFGEYFALTEYNRISTLLHYVIPFTIQFVSITLLITRVARQRRKTLKSTTTLTKILKKTFSIQKELYITPIITVLSTIPQAILSFSLTCTQPNGWQRHLLLIVCLLSYAPHVLSFFIHVIPSSLYKKEFTETTLAKILAPCLCKLLLQRKR